MTLPKPVRVSLVGIGPGSPGLVTLRAMETIRAADVVRHPLGLDPAIIGMARPGALIEPYRSDTAIMEIVEAGFRIAVLYLGDPFAFSRGHELAELLYAAGHDYEVIPGVLLESAGPALSGIPLNLMSTASERMLRGIDGQTAALRVEPGQMQATVSGLLETGHSPDAPAAVIFNPGGPGQRKVVAPLRHLAGLAAAGVEGEVLLVVGPGVEASNRLDTHSRRPLHGRRVLVTRARHQAEEFHRHLAELGAWVIDVPTIEVRPVLLDDRMRSAMALLPDTQLVIFASANAVEIFFEMLFELSLDARSLRDSKICAIGPETARSLESHGLRPELVAGEYTAEGLAEALRGWDLRDARILVPRAQLNRDALPQILAKRGARVEILPVYGLASPAGLHRSLRRAFEGEQVDAVTFTSSSTVVNFAGAFGEGELGPLLKKTRIACMGPVTADTARHLGMRVDIIAEEYTTRGLAQAIAAYFN